MHINQSHLKLTLIQSLPLDVLDLGYLGIQEVSTFGKTCGITDQFYLVNFPFKTVKNDLRGWSPCHNQIGGEFLEGF